MKNLLLAMMLMLVGCEAQTPIAPPKKYVMELKVVGTSGPFSAGSWQATVSDAPDADYPQGNMTSFSAPVSLPWTSGPITVSGGSWAMGICSPSPACVFVVVDNGVTLISRSVSSGCQTADGSVQ